MFLRLVVLLLFACPLLSASIRDLIDAVNIVHVNSITQKVCGRDSVEFEGEVEIFIDRTFHVWADKVEINKKEQQLTAYAYDDRFILVETEGILVLAQRFSFDLLKKEGAAEKVRVHLKKGFVSADKVNRFSEHFYSVEDLLYTPCDKKTPHWSIRAQRAYLYSNYLIRASGVLFKVGHVPILGMPTFVVPLQKRSQSGFLIPKFSYDQEFGIGVKEEFYWHIASRCDSTIGVAFRQRHGIVVSDEFRWARAPEAFTHINLQYAKEHNAFVKKADVITKGNKTHSWIKGDNFQHYRVADHEIKSLCRVDLGTDKRIGYHFFNTTQDVEDSFYNAAIFRYPFLTGLISMLFDREKTVRNQFTDVLLDRSDEQSVSVQEMGVREVEDRVLVERIPHVQVSTVYRRFFNLFEYKHDFFIDHAFSQEQSTEKDYFNARLISLNRLISPLKQDTVRFCYQAMIQKSFSFLDQQVRFFCSPSLQFHNHLKDPTYRAHHNVVEGRWFSSGAYRLFAEYGVEWALPEKFMYTNDYAFVYAVQPVLQWEYTPKFFQDHWLYFDQWDRAYPKNEIAFLLRNNWIVKDIEFDLYLKQRYEFYSKEDIFPLRRSIGSDHLLPLQSCLQITGHGFDCFFSQEFDWKSATFLQLDVNAEFFRKQTGIRVGCFYRDLRLHKEQKLFSDIPLFFLFGLKIPIGKKVMFRYDSQFYARGTSWRIAGSTLRPLLHHVYFEYKGHCWSIMLGFEEKRYRQQGNWRSEHAFVVSFGLDTLGSFSGRVRRPILMRDW